MKALGSCIVVTLLLSSGCATLRPAEAGYGTDKGDKGSRRGNSSECESIDSKHAMWGGLAAVAGLFGVGGGVGTAAVEDADVRTPVGIGTGVLAAFGAFSVYMSQHYAEKHNLRCSQPSD